MEKANSNKEILACLLVLGTGIEISENAILTTFISKTLQSNNSMIKVEVIQYVLSDNLLATQFDSTLKNLLETEKNPFIKGILEASLS